MLYDSLVYQDPSSSGLCAGVDSLEDDAASLVASVARAGPGVTGAAVTSLDNMDHHDQPGGQHDEHRQHDQPGGQYDKHGEPCGHWTDPGGGN